MVLHAFGNDGQNLNEKYLQARIDALHNTVSLDVWGDIDIERYDLDDLPGELGGPMYQPQYKQRPEEGGEIGGDSFDIRDLPTHD